MSKFWGVFVTSLLLFTAAPLLAETFTAVRNGSATSTIIIGRNSTYIEKHAATELQKYLSNISSSRITILTEGGYSVASDRNLILVGRTETNPLIKNLQSRGLINLTSENPGLDGFIIKQVADGDKNYLVIGGSMDRGTLFGVYHFLENVCKVGFFWDGEYIPHNKTLAFKNLDITERPKFKYREYMQNCASFGYSGNFWNTDDWKKEIDWMAKKKMNLIDLATGTDIVWKMVYKDFGVDQNPTDGWENYQMETTNNQALSKTGWDKFQMEMTKKALSYARKLGIDTVAPGAICKVPEAFMKKYPKINYLVAQWQDLPKEYYIHPDDPMYVQLGSAFIKRYNKTYGMTHFYTVDPYPELNVKLSDDEKKKLPIDFARNTIKMLKMADPGAIWTISCWAFTYDSGMWNREAVRNFLKEVPKDMFIANDVYAESGYAVYPKLDNFGGWDWGFGVLTNFGGHTHMFGDMAGLIKKIKDVTDTDIGRNCVNFYIDPEIVHYNTAYFDLCTFLSWNPDKVTLDSFINDYVVRRYGSDQMRTAWKILSEGIYTTQNNILFDYKVRLDDNPEQYRSHTSVYIDPLKKAIEASLKERDALKDNPLYQNDLIDFTRQYISYLFDFHIIQMFKAFKNSDIPTFNKEAEIVNRLLDIQENILTLKPQYSMEEETSRAMKLPSFKTTMKNDRYIRQRYTMLVDDLNHWQTILDYARKDLYELVKYYYRPRVDIYEKYLRNKISSNSRGISNDELNAEYKQVLINWLDEGYPKETHPITRDIPDRINELFKEAQIYTE